MDALQVYAKVAEQFQAIPKTSFSLLHAVSFYFSRHYVILDLAQMDLQDLQGNDMNCNTTSSISRTFIKGLGTYL
jgi:hypothetical protein